MRLLLDEMYDPTIAEQLRGRGHDVASVYDFPTLVSVDDRDLLLAAIAEGRALVTENVRDLVPIETEIREAGTAHFGLVLTSNRRFPRHRSQVVGALVRALDVFLNDHGEDEPTSRIWWLRPTE